MVSAAFARLCVETCSILLILNGMLISRLRAAIVKPLKNSTSSLEGAQCAPLQYEGAHGAPYPYIIIK